MLDGGLCWRIGKDKAERQAEDASRHLNPKHVDVEKQRKKDVALKKKTAALADPDLLTVNVVAPGESMKGAQPPRPMSMSLHQSQMSKSRLLQRGKFASAHHDLESILMIVVSMSLGTCGMHICLQSSTSSTVFGSCQPCSGHVLLSLSSHF